MKNRGECNGQIGERDEAIRRLRDGAVIGFPTETFYGLGADPSNPGAVGKLLDLKGRSAGAGVPLIIDDIGRLEDIAGAIDPVVWKLANRFWPGPLTFVVSLRSDRGRRIQPGVMGGDGSVALRVSSCPLARELAAGIGGMITATSANPHGEVPPRKAEEVEDYFPELFIVRAFEREMGAPLYSAPSTIVDVRSWPFRLIREGAIPWAEVECYLFG